MYACFLLHWVRGNQSILGIRFLGSIYYPASVCNWQLIIDNTIDKTLIVFYVLFNVNSGIYWRLHGRAVNIFGFQSPVPHLCRFRFILGGLNHFMWECNQYPVGLRKDCAWNTARRRTRGIHQPMITGKTSHDQCQ